MYNKCTNVEAAVHRPWLKRFYFKCNHDLKCNRALILFIQTLALYKSFTYLLTYLLTYIVLGTGCTPLLVVPRSTEISTLRDMVKWLSGG